MKKLLIFSAVVFSFFATTPVFSAPDIGLGKGGTADQIAGKGGYDTTGVTDTTLSESVGRIIKVALSFVGTIFFALTIYAGFLWMTASGNEEQVSKAKGIIKMAVIGMVITLAAYSITTYVLVYITGATTSSTQVGS